MVSVFCFLGEGKRTKEDNSIVKLPKVLQCPHDNDKSEKFGVCFVIFFNNLMKNY